MKSQGNVPVKEFLGADPVFCGFFFDTSGARDRADGLEALEKRLVDGEFALQDVRVAKGAAGGVACVGARIFFLVSTSGRASLAAVNIRALARSMASFWMATVS